MKIARVAAAALALVVVSVVPAAAQASEVPVASPVVQSGVWSVTPFLSFTFGGDSDTTSLGLGAAAGYDFTGNIGVEGEFAFVFDLAADDEDADWSVASLGANVLYHFPLENGMFPYATAGVGFARSAVTTGDVSHDSVEVGFNVGGGIKAPLTDTFSARGDIRYFKYNDAAPDGFRIYGGLTWKLSR